MKKRGFTLIELIVAMVMAVLLLGALVPLMTLSQKENYDGQRQTRANQAGEAIYEYVAGQVRAANRVFVGHGAPGEADALYPDDWENWNRITVDENGQLTVNGQTIYPADYQQTCTLQLQARGRDRTVLDLTVRLADARGENNKGLLYEKESAVTLQNLTLNAFAQTEGLVGEALSAGEGGGAGAAAGAYGPLVLYYIAADMTISPFPTPGGDVDPGGPGGGTVPGSFNVFLSPTQVTLKVGASQKVQATVTKPAGWGEPAYTWAWADEAYAAVAQSGGPAATVTGKQSTDGEAKTLSLTVKVADAEGAAHEKTVTASVRVVEEKPTEPTGEFILTTKKNYSEPDWFHGDDTNKDVNRQTLYWNVNELPQGFSLAGLKILSTVNIMRLTGTWSVSSDAPQAFRDACAAPDNRGVYYLYRGKPETGTVTFTFTSDGGWLDPTDPPKGLKGQWATVTIVFYDPADIADRLVFEENGQTEFIADYPEDDRYIVGTKAATVRLHLKGGTDGVQALLTGATVSLDCKAGNNGWRGSNTLLRKPAAVPLPVANADGSYDVRIPLIYARQTLAPSEPFPGIFATVHMQEGVSIQVGPVYFTAGKQLPTLPDPILTFADFTSTEETVTYYEGGSEDEGNLYTMVATAVLRFEFDKDSDAGYYAGGRAVLESTAWEGRDPLIEKPAEAVLQGPTQNPDNHKWMVTARIPLKLMREPEKGSETIQITGRALTAADQKSNAINLTVKRPETGIVLRRGKYDAAGRIVNGKTISVGRNTKGLEFTAYADSAGSVPLDGYWRSTRYFLGLFENGISDAQGAWALQQYRKANWYTDKQNGTGTRTGTGGDTVQVSFSREQNSEQVYVNIKLVDVDEIKTGLTAGKDAVFVGEDVPLTLTTRYEAGAAYSVEWKVSRDDLFQAPAALTGQQGRGDEDSITPVTLRAARGAAVEEDTQVEVVAVWKDAAGNEIGRDAATVRVEPRVDPAEPPSEDMRSDKDDTDIREDLYEDTRDSSSVSYKKALGGSPQDYRKTWYHWDGSAWEEAAVFEGTGGSTKAFYGAMFVMYEPDFATFYWNSAPAEDQTERFQLIAENKKTGQIKASQVITMTVKAAES